MTHSETELANAGYLTQFFNPGDIENVKTIQAGYKVQPSPKAAPTINFIEPLTRDEIKTSRMLFEQLNFAMGD